LGKNCGIMEDNCGNTLDCGVCSSEDPMAMDMIENAIKNKLK